MLRFDRLATQTSYVAQNVKKIPNIQIGTHFMVSIHFFRLNCWTFFSASNVLQFDPSLMKIAINSATLRKVKFGKIQPCATSLVVLRRLRNLEAIIHNLCATLRQTCATLRNRATTCDKLVQPYAPCDNLVQPGTTLLQSHFGDCIFVKGIQYTDFISSSKCEIIQKITSGHILSWYPSFFRLSRYPGAHFGTRDSQNVSKHLILELSIISIIHQNKNNKK